MGNRLLEEVEFAEEQTGFGVWWRYGFEDGSVYREFKSYQTVWGMPLLHYTAGRHPQTGKRVWAKGFIAVGRKAMGVIAIGQLAIGLIVLGQAAIGLLWGMGQITTGIIAVGQCAIGAWFAMGQVAVGTIAIGQFGIGMYVLGQAGVGKYLWTAKEASSVAKEFFQGWPIIRQILGN